MIVVDAAIIGALYLPASLTEQAEQLLRRDPEWAAPLSWRNELRRVLASCWRQHKLDLELAQRICAAAEQQMRGREYVVPTAEVLERCRAKALSIEACELIVLAEDLGVPLITADTRLAAAYPQVAHALKTWALQR